MNRYIHSTAAPQLPNVYQVMVIKDGDVKLVIQLAEWNDGRTTLISE